MYTVTTKENSLRIVFACLVSLVVLVSLFCLYGCSQLPVLRGSYQKDKVEQAKVDSKQSDVIADVASVDEATLQVLGRVDDLGPALEPVRVKAHQIQARASADAERGRERADREERKQEAMAAAPGPMDFFGRAMVGDWAGLLDLAMGALGLGGAAYGVRSRLKSRQVVEEVVDGVERYTKEAEDGGEKLKVCLSRSMDKRTKELVRKVKG